MLHKRVPVPMCSGKINQKIFVSGFQDIKETDLKFLHYGLEFLLEKIKAFLDIFKVLATGKNNFS